MGSDAAAAGIGIEAIGQIAVNARDVPRAVAFYRDVLGLTYLFEAPGLAFFDCGGVRLMLSRPESAEFDHPASIIYYRVADIESTHAALAARGADIMQPPHVVHRTDTHELWMCFARDPEGNVLGVMQEKGRG